MESRVAIASTSSGVSRARKRYISSRHAQKLSPSGPALCVRPAIARWNACECRFGIPGTTGPFRRSAATSVMFVATLAITPSSPTTISTWSAQPEGSIALEARYRRGIEKRSVVPGRQQVGDFFGESAAPDEVADRGDIRREVAVLGVKRNPLSHRGVHGLQLRRS